jgi:hypothetical protein
LLNVVIWLQENTLRTGDLLRRLVVSKICQDPSRLFCGGLGKFLRAATHTMKTPPFHLTSTLRVATRKFSVQKVFFGGSSGASVDGLFSTSGGPDGYLSHPRLHTQMDQLRPQKNAQRLF